MGKKKKGGSSSSGKSKKSSGGSGIKRKRESWKYYKIDGDQLVRIKQECPECGAGYFMAEHQNRLTCGNCYTTQWLSEAEA